MESRLNALADASARIFGAATLDDTLKRVTEEARHIVGAHQCVASLTVGTDWSQAIVAISLSDKYAAWRTFDAKPAGMGISATVCSENRPMRLTQAELEAHPAWRALGTSADRHPPLRGWMAVPMTARDGTNLGLIQLSDKDSGDFDAADEAVIVQLARQSALAVENIRLVQKARAAEHRFQEFAEIASDWLWETDAEHRFTFFGGARGPFDRPYGKTRWELAEADAADPKWQNHFADLAARRPFRNFEYARRDPNGRARHASVSGNPIFADDGRFLGYRGTTSDLTERREAEAKALEAADQYRRIVETTNEGVWIVDSEARSVFVNRRVGEMLGYAPEEILGRKVHEFRPAENAETIESRWAARRQGVAGQREARFLHRDGTIFWAQISAQPLTDADGKFAGSLGMVTDITARKAAEVGLKASERRFKDFAAVASDWMWETDPAHRFTYFSPSRDQSQRDPSSGALGRTRWEYAGADPADPVWRAHFADLEARRPFTRFEYAYRRPDGSTGVSLINGMPVFADDGTFAGYRGTATDVTAQRAAEAAAREASEQFRHVVETANEGLWITDENAHIVFANNRIAEMLGYRPEELLGRPIFDFIPADRIDEVRRHWGERRANKVARFEARHKRKDGREIWVLVSTSPRHDGEGAFAGTITMFVDISDRKRAEAAAAASEKRFKDFAEIASDWLWETDSEHRLTYVAGQVPGNDRVYYGRTRWEVPGTAADEAAWRDHRADLAARRAFRDFRFTVEGNNGRIHHYVASGRPIFDESGTFFGYRGTTSDRTRQHEAETAARESERKFRRIVETADEGIWMLDAEWRTSYVNPRMAEMLGYAESEMLGRTPLDFLPPDAHARSVATRDSRVANRVEKREWQFLRKDGTRVWTLVTSNTIENPNDGAPGVLGMVADITDLKRAEETALRSKEEMEALLASVSDGFVAFDNEWRFVYVNPAAERIIGRSGAQLIGRRAFDSLHIAPDNVFDACYTVAKREGDPVFFTAFSDQFRLWLEVRAQPHPGGLTIFFRDVTAERRGHLALAAAGRDLRDALEANESILASATEGFVAFDDDWRFTHVNAAAEQIWNVRAKDLIGRTVFDVMRIDETNPFFAVYRQSKENGGPIAFAAYSEMFGKWIEVRGFPHAAGYAQFFHDVSDERRVHHALIESQKRLEAAREMNQRIFESSLDLICITDRNGRFVQVNPGTSEQFGYPMDELIGHDASEFIHDDDVAVTRAAMRESRKSQTLHTFENRCLRKDGVVVHMNWSVAWSEAEQKYFLIGRDLTERIQVQERLNRSQRLEAIGQLTGGIAHDFNNLLTVIMGNSDMLVRALKERDTLRRQAELSLEAARRAAELTAQLLSFARRQTLAPDAVDANTLVEDVKELIQRTLGTHIEIALERSPDIWPCKADSTQLETALVNLALNARDAMPQGGRLTIATAGRSVAAAAAGAASELLPGDYVVISVADTGVGMPPEILARVFEPFFTTKEIGKGSGLGLPMVYGFVKQSGGHVAIDSAPGWGTKVSLYLPRAVERTVPSPRTAPDNGPLPGGSELILVVEDDPAVRDLVCAQLGRLGYRVRVAGNGATARNILLGGEKVDLLFTDLMMPGGVTGPQLAAEATARLPEIEVLFTSGYADMSALEPGLARAAFLRKPYKVQDLAHMVRRSLDRAAEGHASESRVA